MDHKKVAKNVVDAVGRDNLIAALTVLRDYVWYLKTIRK